MGVRAGPEAVAVVAAWGGGGRQGSDAWCHGQQNHVGGPAPGTTSVGHTAGNIESLFLDTKSYWFLFFYSLPYLLCKASKQLNNFLFIFVVFSYKTVYPFVQNIVDFHFSSI